MNTLTCAAQRARTRPEGTWRGGNLTLARLRCLSELSCHSSSFAKQASNRSVSPPKQSFFPRPALLQLPSMLYLAIKTYAQVNLL